MRLGHVTFERELVEQGILLDLPIPHHRLPPGYRDLRKPQNYTTILKEFFNTIGRRQPILHREEIGGSGVVSGPWHPGFPPSAIRSQSASSSPFPRFGARRPQRAMKRHPSARARM